MAQVNAGFQLDDSSNLKSFEKIQVDNDIKLAKALLITNDHQLCYVEPLDCEQVARNYVSNTFVDFLPRILGKVGSVDYDDDEKDGSIEEFNYCSLPNSKAETFKVAMKSSNAKTKTKNKKGNNKKLLRSNELESLCDLFARVNLWLLENRFWRAVSIETLLFEPNTMFNVSSSSVESVFLPQYARGLRVWLETATGLTPVPQRVSCINVVPRKLKLARNTERYETIDEMLTRLNELLIVRPIEGKVLNVETISLPMFDGLVDAEASFCCATRLNSLLITNQNSTSSRHETNDKINNDSEHCDSLINDQQVLVDVLRVFYERGIGSCGAIRLVDFVPRAHFKSSRGGKVKLETSEPLSDLLHRSMNFVQGYDNDNGYDNSKSTICEPLGNDSHSTDCENISVKFCNVQVCQKVAFIKQVGETMHGSVKKFLDTREAMIKKLKVDDTQNEFAFNVKFVRLAIVGNLKTDLYSTPTIDVRRCSEEIASLLGDAGSRQNDDSDNPSCLDDDLFLAKKEFERYERLARETLKLLNSRLDSICSKHEDKERKEDLQVCVDTQQLTSLTKKDTNENLSSKSRITYKLFVPNFQAPINTSRKSTNCKIRTSSKLTNKAFRKSKNLPSAIASTPEILATSSRSARNSFETINKMQRKMQVYLSATPGIKKLVSVSTHMVRLSAYNESLSNISQAIDSTISPTFTNSIKFVLNFAKACPRRYRVKQTLNSLNLPLWLVVFVAQIETETNNENIKQEEIKLVDIDAHDGMQAQSDIAIKEARLSACLHPIEVLNRRSLRQLPDEPDNQLWAWHRRAEKYRNDLLFPLEDSCYPFIEYQKKVGSPSVFYNY